MKILFYQWHSFMNEGVERAWKQLGIEYDTLFYQQSDWEVDDGIVDLLEKKLKQKKYDMVFSINYAPLVSMVCEREQVRYVSWVYDAPIHIRNIETMKNSCNRIFFFDRIQAEKYKKQGIRLIICRLQQMWRRFHVIRQSVMIRRIYLWSENSIRPSTSIIWGR